MLMGEERGGGRREGRKEGGRREEVFTLTVPLLSTNHLLRSSMASALERELERRGEGGEGVRKRREGVGRGEPVAT